MGAKENFMYDEKGSNHLKLIDFGFSKAWDPEKNKKLKMNCALLAPQVITLANDHDFHFSQANRDMKSRSKML